MKNRHGSTDFVSALTPRQREVVVLIGRYRLSYKQAARRMAHRYMGDRTVSPETVRDHAQTIRDRLRSPLSPRDAVTELYWMHRDEFEQAA